MLPDVLECIVDHLEPPHVNLLLRTSRAMRDCVQAHEESYWSQMRVVRIFREASVRDGKIRMSWIRRKAETFELEPILGARDILQTLWRIKRSRDMEDWSLFVDCEVWPDLLSVSMPCYLLRTKNSTSRVTDEWPCDRKLSHSGW